VCSSCSCSFLLSFRCGFEFSLDEVSDGSRVPGGQSAGAWRTLRVLPRTVRFSGFATGGSVGFNGRSTTLGRMVRGTGADSPRYPVEQSARAWLFCSLVRFLPPSFVLPCVLQGIVPRT
jgi:hypothetical protein